MAANTNKIETLTLSSRLESVIIAELETVRDEILVELTNYPGIGLNCESCAFHALKTRHLELWESIRKVYPENKAKRIFMEKCRKNIGRSELSVFNP